MKTLYLVSGASGFVGNTVVKMLQERGDDVRVFVRNEQKTRQTLGDVDIVLGDVRNKNELKGLFRQDDDCEYIFVHTAAMVDIGTTKITDELYSINVLGTQNVVDVCLEHNVKRLLYVSSVHAITEPKNNALTLETLDFNADLVHGGYAKTKAMASKIVVDAIKNKGLKAVMVHPSGIAGPNDFGNTHLTQMILDYNENKIPVAVKGGYDFVDVRDVAWGILQAIDKAPDGENYLLTNKYYSVNEVLSHLYELLHKKNVKTTLPIWVAKMGLPFMTAAAKAKKQRPLYTAYSLYTLQSNSNFSHQKAADAFGYKPRDLKEILQDAVEFLRGTGRI